MLSVRPSKESLPHNLPFPPFDHGDNTETPQQQRIERIVRELRAVEL